MMRAIAPIYHLVLLLHSMLHMTFTSIFLVSSSPSWVVALLPEGT